MSISKLYMQNELVDRVFMNGEECDFVYGQDEKVFSRQAEAGSVTFNTVGAYEWTIPEGVSVVTFCVAGGGGGGGALRGGGGGGGGGVSSLQDVSAVADTVFINIGAGGAGSTQDSVRASTGGTSLAFASGMTTVTGDGGQGGITDGFGVGGSGGGDGGDGDFSEDGDPFTGCGGSYVGGAGSAASIAGGGGAGGFGDGGRASTNPEPKGVDGEQTGGGGGTYDDLSGYAGGKGGDGQITISWDAQ